MMLRRTAPLEMFEVYEVSIEHIFVLKFWKFLGLSYNLLHQQNQHKVLRINIKFIVLQSISDFPKLWNASNYSVLDLTSIVEYSVKSFYFYDDL